MGCVDSHDTDTDQKTNPTNSSPNYKTVSKTPTNKSNPNTKTVEIQETSNNTKNNESKDTEEQELISNNTNEIQISPRDDSDTSPKTKQKEYKIVVESPPNPDNTQQQQNNDTNLEETDENINENEPQQKGYKIVIEPPQENTQSNNQNDSEEEVDENINENIHKHEYEIEQDTKEESEEEQEENIDEYADENHQSDEEQNGYEQKQNNIIENDQSEEDENEQQEQEEYEHDYNDNEDDEYKIENIHKIFETLDRKRDINKNMKTCNVLKRIAIILNEYKKWMDIMDNNDINEDEKIENNNIVNIINKYSSDYNLIELVNDFNFLLFEHSNDIELENMYNNICDILQCKPKIDNCSAIKRNQRDKSMKYNAQMEILYYGINDNKQIITIQILDNIYCYFLHSFDILFKLLSNEKLQIEQQINEQKENEYNKENNENEINIIDINLLETTRFVEDFQTFESIRGEERLKKNKYLRNINNKRVFHFVEMFMYSNDQKGETMYVEAKYDTLKNELTQNNICNIDIKQWNEIYEKANIYIQTNHCKQNVKANKTMFADIYQINYKTAVISIEQLIAICIYSNFDVLQRKFSKTFIKKSREEDVYDVIARHSSFAVFGRLLREAVEVFGSELNQKSKYQSFYHGISAELTLFNQSFCDYSGPLSTSCNYQVVLNYVINNNGLIVELSKGRKEDVFYFDCQWLSDHINEQEQLFFLDGGHRLDVNNPIYGHVLRIESLLNISLGHNYSIYATALNVLRHLMNGQNYYSDLVNRTNNINQQTKDVIYKLLMHQMYKESELNDSNNNEFEEFKTIPKYIDNVLDSFCVSRTQINIDWIQMNEETQNKFLFDLLCTNNDEQEDMMGFININRFKMLFPNLNKIEVRYIFLTDAVIYNIFEYIDSIANNSELKVKEITIRDPGQQSLSIQQALEQYADKFEDKDYNMYEWEGDSGMLKYLTFQNMDAAYDDSGDEPLFSDEEIESDD